MINKGMQIFDLLDTTPYIELDFESDWGTNKGSAR
jgi:hypothetical protein